MTWLLLLALAHAAPEDALDAATRPFYLRAVEEEDAGRPTAAAGYYRLVLGKDPAFVPASLGLGRVLEASGDAAGAEEVYRSLGAEPDAVEALARLVEHRGDIEGALRLWGRLETLRYGDPTPYREEARLLARTDPEKALEAFNQYRSYLLGQEPDGPTVLDVGNGLVQGGRPEDAEGLWRRHLEDWPDSAIAEELRNRLDGMELKRAAEEISLGGSEPLPAELAGRYAAVQEAMASGDLALAAEEGHAIVAAAPRSAAARGLLADVLVAQKHWDEAEKQAVIARELAPDEPANRVRLGMLLVNAYGGRRDREAVDELREAALLRPGEGEIQLALARVEQRLGNYDRALQAWQRLLDAGAQGAAADEARTQIEALRREPPEAPTAPVRVTNVLPSEAESHYRVALVLARRGLTEKAITELEAALALAPAAPVLLNKRAQLAGQVGGSAEPWLERSLAADPDQPPVLLALGDVAKARGDDDTARRWYTRAAAAGSADAHFLLARLAEERGDWREASAELKAYEAGAPGSASLHAEPARELRERLARRDWGRRAAAIAALVVGLGVPLGAWARYRTTRTLRDLLDGAPECWHDAARLLAALRHEVLKHNTTVLPDIADALERGETGAWIAFSERAPQLLRHFRTYLGELEALGRRHGFRLGLRGRDPILGPMHRALTKLARSRRPPRPDDLRALSEVINGRGYAAIGQIVREICVLPVTEERVRDVYTRVVKEPGFAGTSLPDLAVNQRETGLAVRMFRADLEDILANLLRNALGAGAVTVAVDLGPYDDPITGHAWVEVAVQDDAPGTLTNAMIRGRYIGRGLGLAVDLINRHGGSIRVEGRGEGKKAVIVQLPSVEAAPVEVEWTT